MQACKGNQKFSLENNHLVFQKPGEEKQDRRQAMEEMQSLCSFLTAFSHLGNLNVVKIKDCHSDKLIEVNFDLSLTLNFMVVPTHG